jgi:hypothetical protein
LSFNWCQQFAATISIAALGGLKCQLKSIVGRHGAPPIGFVGNPAWEGTVPFAKRVGKSPVAARMPGIRVETAAGALFRIGRPVVTPGVTPPFLPS